MSYFPKKRGSFRGIFPCDARRTLPPLPPSADELDATKYIYCPFCSCNTTDVDILSYDDIFVYSVVSYTVM